MPIRRRIRHSSQATIMGGGGAPVAPTFHVGPNFGDGFAQGITHEVGVLGPNLDALSMAGEIAAGVHAQATSIAADLSATPQAVGIHQSIDLAANYQAHAVGVHPSNDANALVALQAVGATAANPSNALAAQQGIAAQLANPANAIAYTAQGVGVRLANDANVIAAMQTVGARVTNPSNAIAAQQGAAVQVANPANAIAYTAQQAAAHLSGDMATVYTPQPIGCQHTNPKNALDNAASIDLTKTVDSSGNGLDGTFEGSTANFPRFTSPAVSGFGYGVLLASAESSTASNVGGISLGSSAEDNMPTTSFRHRIIFRYDGPTGGSGVVQVVCGCSDGSIQGTEFAGICYINTTGKLVIESYTSASVKVMTTGSTVLVSGTVYEAEFNWNGATVRILLGPLGGTIAVDGSSAMTTQITRVSTPYRIGKRNGPTNGLPLKATILDFELGKTALHTSSYTSTGLPFTSDSNTLALLHMQPVTHSFVPGAHLSATAIGAPSLVASTFGTRTTAAGLTTLVVTKPAGVVAGDLLLILAAASVNPPGLTLTLGTVTGFTTPTGGTASAAGIRMAVSYRIADGTEASSFTITGSAALHGCIECHVIRGVNSAAPFDGSVAMNDESSTTTQTADPTAPSVTTSGINRMVFYWNSHIHATSSTHTPPASNTEAEEEESDTVSATGGNSGYRIFSASGSTGTASINCSETLASDSGTMRFAIVPGTLILAV